MPNARRASLLQRATAPLPAVVARPRRRSRRAAAAGRASDAEVLQALLGVLADVVGREDVVERRTRDAPATCGSSAGSWSRRRAACRDAAQRLRRAAARCGRRRRPRRCRRSCSRARWRGRATRTTPRRRCPSTPPCPTCRSPLRDAAQTVDTASGDDTANPRTSGSDLERERTRDAGLAMRVEVRTYEPQARFRAGCGESLVRRRALSPLAPVVLADRPDHLIVIDAIAQERSAQHAFAGRPQLLQRAVAAAAADRRARFQPVDAHVGKDEPEDLLRSRLKIAVPQKLEPMAAPIRQGRSPATACAPGRCRSPGRPAGADAESDVAAGAALTLGPGDEPLEALDRGRRGRDEPRDFLRGQHLEQRGGVGEPRSRSVLAPASAPAAPGASPLS